MTETLASPSTPRQAQVCQPPTSAEPASTGSVEGSCGTSSAHGMNSDRSDIYIYIYIYIYTHIIYISLPLHVYTYVCIHNVYVQWSCGVGRWPGEIRRPSLLRRPDEAGAYPLSGFLQNLLRVDQIALPFFWGQICNRANKSKTILK